MFNGISLNSNAPIYEQLIEKIEYMVINGVLEPDDPLPSVRELAADLAVNPNTVQKAYSELEHRGVTYSVIGKGRFVTGDKEKILNRKIEKEIEHLNLSVAQLKRLGVSRDEVTGIINNAWRCEE